MPNTRITGLTEDTTPADDDLVATVDVSDTTQSAQGSTKKVQAQNLVVKKVRTSTGPTVLTVGAVADGEFLKRSGTSIISAAAGGGGLGDVVGPGSATDNAIARFDGTTGKLIQNSGVTVGDDGSVTVPEIAAPSTPASGQVVIYAKSDGLVYGKDDLGTETKLSNDVGGGGPTINPTDNVIPRRSNSTTFADSFLSHDTANGWTASSGHILINNNTNKILAFGTSSILGGWELAGVGAMMAVSDSSHNPGAFLSNFNTAPPETPTHTIHPWSSVGMNFRHVLDGNTTIGNPGQSGGTGTALDGYRFVLMLVQDATGGRTVTWSSDFKFPGGTTPTMTSAANAVDIYEFICFNDIAYCIGIFQDVK